MCEHIVLRLLVGIRFQVLFHSGHPGPFHLSLTVLVHYRSPKVFSLGRWSPQLPTGFHVPRGTQETSRSFAPFVYGSITLYAPSFQCSSTRREICNFLESLQRLRPALTTPTLQRLQPSSQRRFRLFPFRSPLLRESFLFLWVLRCFSSPGAPQLPYVFR